LAIASLALNYHSPAPNTLQKALSADLLLWLHFTW
jgi:hypothetical protein